MSNGDRSIVLLTLAAMGVVLLTFALRGALLIGQTFVRRMEGRCIHCGYSLRGLPQQRCPECGHVA